jgi:hypothetical protein
MGMRLHGKRVFWIWRIRLWITVLSCSCEISFRKHIGRVIKNMLQRGRF